MGNMGTIPATGYESSVVQTFSSPTGTSHTMTYTASVNDMILVINNVIQEPTVAYTTSGTTLTTGTLISSDTMYIIYLALTRQTSAPGADTVTNAMIVDNAINSEHYTDGSIDLAHMSVNSIDSDQYVDASIDNAHLADDAVNSDELAAGAVDLAHMSATGTASSSTFLRGDNAWATAGGGAWTLITSTHFTSATAAVEFTTGIDGTYRTYVVHVESATMTSNIAKLRVALGDSSGFDTASADYSTTGWYSQAATAGSQQGGDDNMATVHGGNTGTASGSNFCGEFIFTRPTDSVSFPHIRWHIGSYNHSPVATEGGGNVVRKSAITVDRIKFVPDSGTIARGRFTLYGIAHA